MQSDALHGYDLPEFAIRFFQKSANADDLKELHQWLQDDIKHQRLFDENQDVWLASGKLKSAAGYNSDQAWKKLFPEIKSRKVENSILPQKLFNWKKLVQVAAIVLIAFVAGVFAMQYFSQSGKSSVKSVTEHSVPYGSRSMVILPDGTRIWLNAGSKLTYNQNYNINSRELTLTGEAYFDVKANPKLPFMVHTALIIVKVTGTAFNIKAYPDEKVIEATVERGQVNIVSREKNITVNPRQKVIIFKIAGQTKPETITEDSVSGAVQNKIHKRDTSESRHFVMMENVDTELSTSWKDKRWIIEREELGSLSVKIGRRYDVDITFASENLKHFVFSGALEDESLEQVLRVIRFTSPISYIINKKKVMLREDSYLKQHLK